MVSNAIPSEPDGPASVLAGAQTMVRSLIETGALAGFLGRQRWFARGGRPASRLAPVDGAVIAGDPPLVLALVDADGDLYYVPLALRPAGTPATAPPEREVGRAGDWVAYDAHWAPRLGRFTLGAMAQERRVAGTAGAFAFHRAADAKPVDDEEIGEMPVTPVSTEQSNTSLLLGTRLILKSFRRPPAGPNPELEIAQFLTTRTSFAHAAGLAGWMEYTPIDGPTATLCLVRPFLESRGDAWRETMDHLRRLGDVLVQEPAPAHREARERRLRELGGDFLEEMAGLGGVTGELHAALAVEESLPAFAPEPITRADVDRWVGAIRHSAARLLDELGGRSARLPEAARRATRRLRGVGGRIERRLGDLALLADEGAWKIRCHGDFHLGQVLRTAGGFAVIDFEGEPERPLADRRAKHSALRDVAGLLRSFDYAAHATMAERPPTDGPALGRWLGQWTRLVSAAFLRGYLDAARRSPRPLGPRSPEAFRRACGVFEIEKALYELRYELEHRPEWVPIPAAGLARLLRARRGD